MKVAYIVRIDNDDFWNNGVWAEEPEFFSLKAVYKAFDQACSLRDPSPLQIRVTEIDAEEA